MPYNFDQPINRRESDSVKWTEYRPDVIPMWVADTDFRAPEAVMQALHKRVDEGVFGYRADPKYLRETVMERLRTRHHMEVDPDHLIFLPNVNAGLNLVSRLVGERGDGVLLATPIYHPFLYAIENQERTLNDFQLVQHRSNGIMRYEIDFDAMEAAITPQTKLFLFCNPHNPVGRVYTRAELERIADICLRHNLFICSDEIHCDLVYDGGHTSIATLSPEIAARTVTLIAPTKTFNIPALGCGIAIVPDDELRQRIYTLAFRSGIYASMMGCIAADAAYREGQPWLDELLPYLRANRDTLVDYVNTHLPGVTVTCPEGTFLAWLDCRELHLDESPHQFFMEKARVGFVDGALFGKGGEGFVRLNFGCTRATLLEALERMRRAVAGR